MGGISPHPSRKQSPAALSERLRAEPSRKIAFSLLEEFFSGTRKSEIVKAIFLRGVPLGGTAAGRSGWFRSGISDKMSSSRVVKTHPATHHAPPTSRSRLMQIRHTPLWPLYQVLKAKEAFEGDTHPHDPFRAPLFSINEGHHFQNCVVFSSERLHRPHRRFSGRHDVFNNNDPRIFGQWALDLPSSPVLLWLFSNDEGGYRLPA